MFLLARSERDRLVCGQLLVLLSLFKQRGLLPGSPMLLQHLLRLSGSALRLVRPDHLHGNNLRAAMPRVHHSGSRTDRRRSLELAPTAPARGSVVVRSSNFTSLYGCCRPARAPLAPPPHPRLRRHAVGHPNGPLLVLDHPLPQPRGYLAPFLFRCSQCAKREAADAQARAPFSRSRKTENQLRLLF